MVTFARNAKMTLSMKNLLTLIIPTYNRAIFLEETLRRLAEYNTTIDFDLIICNNCSEDQTEEVIQKWKPHFKNITCIKHSHFLYYDYNVASGYKAVQTDYCMLLGDCYYLYENDLKHILSTLEHHRPDAIAINSFKGKVKLPSKVYDDLDQLVADLGWHMTMLCSFILKTELIQEYTLTRYSGSAFIHLGVLLDGLASKQHICVYWINEIRIQRLRLHVQENYNPNSKKVSWTSEPFLIFAKRWVSFVLSLSTRISMDAKLRCILEHNSHQHVFRPWKIFRYKLTGRLDMHDYKKSRAYLKWCTRNPIYLYDLINLCPTLWQNSKKKISEK